MSSPSLGPLIGNAGFTTPSIVTAPVAIFSGGPAALGGPSLFAGPTSLPKAGVGSLAEGTSMNFLMLGSIVAAIYVVMMMVVRRASGRRIAVENDGILGI